MSKKQRKEALSQSVFTIPPELNVSLLLEFAGYECEPLLCADKLSTMCFHTRQDHNASIICAFLSVLKTASITIRYIFSEWM